MPARDAVSAMSAAVRCEADLVILDISMPGGSGFEVARRLRAEPRTAQVPLLFLTASERPELRDEAQTLGACGFFEEPYSSEQLLTAIAGELAPRALAPRARRRAFE